MKGYQKVWAALNRQRIARPPAGEVLLTDGFINQFNEDSLESVLAYLNTDLVTLKIDAGKSENRWYYWYQQGYFSFGLTQGPFTLMANKLGWPDMAYLIVNKPAEAGVIMKGLVNQGYELVFQALDAGCEGIIIADDLAGKKGMLVSPEFLNNYYFPLLTRFLQRLGCNEVPFIFHSDGNILDIILSLKATGFWGVQSLQPSAGIRIDTLPHDVLKDWVFWGNYEFEDTVGMKSFQQVKKEVNELLTGWSSYPGYIFGSSGGLYEGIPHEIVKTAYTALHRWKR